MEISDWLSSGANALLIISIIGAAWAAAFKKVADRTSAHTAVLISLQVLGIIAFLVFVVIRFTVPKSLFLPLSLFGYFAFSETTFCIDKRPITRSDVFWACVYPATVFSIYMAEYFARVMKV